MHANKSKFESNSSPENYRMTYIGKKQKNKTKQSIQAKEVYYYAILNESFHW